MQDPKATILHFLELIGYQGDKESYATDFVELSREQALLNMPAEFQQLYMEKLSRTLIDNFQELFEATYEKADENKQKEMDTFLNQLTGAAQ